MVTLADIIDVVSPSKLDAAQQCMAKILFRYVEHLPRTYRADGQFGTAIDQAGNDFYRAKIKTKRNPTKKRLAELFESAWEFEAGAVDEWQGETRHTLLDKGVEMIELWRSRIAQHVQPESAQKPVTMEVPDVITGGTFRLTGIIDMIGRTTGPHLSVVDLKQSLTRYPESRITRSFQPASYTILGKENVFEFHVVTRQATPQIQILRAVISDDDRRSMLLRASMIRRQIGHAFTSGDWLPNRTHQLCSRRYCEFWHTCEKRFGGRVPE